MATSDYQDPRDEFAAAVKAAGLVLDEGPLMDGLMHRVPVEGARPGKRDGAYVGYLDGKPSGFIQNFATGYKENWTASSVRLTGPARAEAAAQMHMARQEREAAQAVQYRQTAEKVAARWDTLSASPSTGQNAYLSRKGVEAHGVKFDGERLIVPVRDVDGKLWSIQTISPDEGAPKLFEKGGRKGANMHVIGEIKAGTEVLVAEGYATGASLHQATGKPVAVAFDSGNLDAVVGALKQRYPTSPIYVLGDDDRAQLPNVGYDKAVAAARNHQVGVAFPQFLESGKLSDFNDLHVNEGLAAVKAQVDKATSLSMEQSREQAALTLAAGRPPIAERERPEREGFERREGSEQLTPRDGVIGAAHVAQAAQVGGPVAHTAVQAIGALDAAKVASDVVQGKEVKALDVASAAASVAMTTGVGGPAVQLGAQAVAGVSAIDAGQRALNTAEAKLKEPDPADVDDRKGIERRSDQIATVPRNTLDEGADRDAVKQDIAALHHIDAPAERHAAAVAMGHNAQSQETYKAELAGQDPYSSEVIAHASALEAQKIAAKEDRKAPEIAAVTPPVSLTASIDTADRTVQREDGINTIERATLRQAATSTTERGVQHDPEVEATKRPRREPALDERFNVVTRFARGRDYHFRDQPGKVAFKERWLSMSSTVDTPVVVKAMIDRAQERGWEAVHINGSEEFKRQAWIAATARGIKAIGYEPTPGDRVAVSDERTRLGLSPTRTGGGLEPATEQRRKGQQFNAPDRAAERQVVAPQPERVPHPERTVPQKAAEAPIAAPLRALLIERGVATVEIEATVALAAERMSRSRVHVGELIAHGTDHYAFDTKNSKSHFVKLQGPSGEKIVWGADLDRSLNDSQLKVGDYVALEHRGERPVTVKVKDYDAAGKHVGEHDEAVKRSAWYAVDVEQLRREAVRQDPAQERRPTRERVSEREQNRNLKSDPAGASKKFLNSREALIAETLEAVLDLQRVPLGERDAVRAALRKDLDVRIALGKPAQIAVYDPAAPAREPQRSVEMIQQRQHKEQVRSR